MSWIYCPCALVYELITTGSEEKALSLLNQLFWLALFSLVFLFDISMDFRNTYNLYKCVCACVCKCACVNLLISEFF